MTYKLKMLVNTYIPTYGLLEADQEVIVSLSVARRWLAYGIAETTLGVTVPPGDSNIYAPMVHTHDADDVLDLTEVLDLVYAAEDHDHDEIASDNEEYGIKATDEALTVTIGGTAYTLDEYIEDVTRRESAT